MSVPGVRGSDRLQRKSWQRSANGTWLQAGARFWPPGLGLIPKAGVDPGDRTIPWAKISKGGRKNKCVRTLFVQAAHVCPSSGGQGQGKAGTVALGSSRHPKRLHRNMLANRGSLIRLARIAVGSSRPAGHAYQAEDHCQLPGQKPCSGPPKGMSATPLRYPSLATLGASERRCGLRRGWLPPDPSPHIKIERKDGGLSTINIDSFPTEVCEME